MSQHVAHEVELAQSQQSPIAATGPAEILDVVQNKEGGVGVLESIMPCTEHPLPRLTRSAIALGRMIEVVIAGAMMPGDASRAQHLQVARVEGEVVGNHIAVIDAEGSAGAQQGGDDVVAHVVELGGILGLRVGYQQRFEVAVLLVPDQRKVERGRQRPGRVDDRKVRAQMLGAALRLMDVGEAWDASRGGWRSPVRGLDHEDAVARLYRQAPASVLGRENDIPAVRHHDTWNSGVAGLPPPVAAAIFEHHAPRHRLGLREACPRKGQRRRAGSGDNLASR